MTTTAISDPFSEAALSRVEEQLAGTDSLLANAYPGDTADRQPVHTVYVAAHLLTADTVAEWGRAALAAVDGVGGLERLAGHLGEELGLDADADLDPAVLARLVEAKLASEPIEDLRVDFEDGLGAVSDAEEDAAVASSLAAIAAMRERGALPPHVGLRFKCFENDTRARGIRTLGLFIAGLAEQEGGLPEGLEITLPKVTTVEQVEAMVYLCEQLEERLGLPAGRLRFEVQVETPQVVIDAEGRVPLARLIHAGGGRVSSLHYGTYDYSASLGVAGGYQSMEHPVADFAKSFIQVAAAGTGVRYSDGSTNIVPAGDSLQRLDAWALHARLVRRSLERAIYQGWDLHAHQLPTRYLASFAFFRTGLSSTITRLDNYLGGKDSAVMDEPATARALAAFLVRGVNCGAVPEQELSERIDVSPDAIRALAYPNRSTKE